MHRPYTRIVKNAETAVLFIHGIVSTPQHFERMIARLPKNCSVMNLLLAGHGGTARDFCRGSMALWQLQVESALTYLAMGHRRVLMVGHSMGALLAMHAALRYPMCASALLLLDAPLRIRVTPMAVTNSLHLGLRLPLPENQEFLAARHSFGVEPTRNPLAYLGWVRHYGELFRLSRQMRSAFEALDVPSVAFQSLKDEMVAPSSAALLRRNPYCHVEMMEHAYHFWYAPEEEERMMTALERMAAREFAADIRA